MTPAPATSLPEEKTGSDRGQTTGIESVADDSTDPAAAGQTWPNPMGTHPAPNEGGAAFPGDGSGATSGYGQETLPDNVTDDEVINGEALSPNEVISDDIDDDVA